MRKFIITVDAEGDNLWEWKLGKRITTNNAEYLERFQSLCERFGFKPVYLVNYEMAQSDVFVETFKYRAEEGMCEIGMHLHAWNTPPEYTLQNRYNGCSYITEYPDDVIRAKHVFLKNYIKDRFGISPVSYRSGRWATNEILFSILNEIGIKIDCSITPGITHERNVGMSVPKGNNYVHESYLPKRLEGDLIEVPMTTIRTRSWFGTSIKNRFSHLIKGEELWLRPAVQSLKDMIRLTKIIEKQKIEYLDFMIHSSELMPGGSPYCKTEEEVEKMYDKIEKYFEYISQDYEGITLQEWYEELNLKL